jgi:phage shock protein E
MDGSYILLILAAAGVGLVLLRQLGNLGTAKAQEFLRRGAAIIDVRTPAEYRSGHLPGAINIPLDELSTRIAQHAPKPDQVLLLHCLSGTRSGFGKRTLRRMGYRNAFNLGSYGRAERIVRAARPPKP